MTNRWIFPTIAICAISAGVLGNAWWGYVVFLIILGRIIFLRQRQVLVWTVLLVSGYTVLFIYFQYHNQVLQQKMNSGNFDSIQITTQIAVDNLYIDGNQLKYTAQLPNKGGNILVNAVIPTQKLKNKLVHTSGSVQITTTGKLGQINKATNLGQFDAQNYYQLQQINGQLTKATVKRIDSKSVFGITAVIHRVRQLVLRYFEKLPTFLRFYGETLILGYVRPDFYQENQGIQELGLLHLFSISGFQVTMLVSLISRGLMRLRIPKELVALVLLGLLPMYFIFSGSIPSLIRSILLGMISQGLILCHRRVGQLDCWSWSLMGGLIFEPGILQMLGGQLSYLLALALIFSKDLRFWQSVIVMNLVTLPLLLYTTYQWHLIALLANFLFIPLFTYVIVPLTTIGVISFKLIPALSYGVNIIIEYLNALIKILSTLPGNIIFGQLPWVLAILATIMTFYLMQKFASWRRWLGLGTLYLCGWLFIQLPLHGEVTFVDIGQGDSILIQTPFKRNVTLIDTGGRLAFHQSERWQQRTKQGKSNAELFLLPYLRQRGISHLDQLILTHTDADHSGDLAVVLQNISVKKVYVGFGLEKLPKYEKLAALYHTKFLPIHAGQIIPATNLETLWPVQPSHGNNEDSVVVCGYFGRQKFIFMGDLDQANERKIIEQVPRLHADVIKLGHHGSKTSSNSEFLKKLQPKIAIISAGRNNRYHHPHIETLTTLATDKIRYFSTARDGMIKYEWSLFNDGWWKMKSE